jgi:hypothetical protein
MLVRRFGSLDLRGGPHRRMWPRLEGTTIHDKKSESAPSKCL